jgi:hypothetical protein
MTADAVRLLSELRCTITEVPNGADGVRAAWAKAGLPA